jgi:hypothetical protein
MSLGLVRKATWLGPASTAPWQSLNPVWVMSKPSESRTHISKLIDHIEQVREELLTIQRSLEELESTGLNVKKEQK